MAAASKVAGALQGGATARGFPIRNHRERENAKANSPRAKMRPGRAERLTPWPAAMEFSGERGWALKEPRFARQMDGEGAGKSGKLTNATRIDENGAGRRLRAANEQLRRRFLAARSWKGAEARGMRSGRGEWLERAGFSPT